MKGGSAIYCPACNHRQAIGEPGEPLDLPMSVVCDGCGATLTVEKSQSGGAHVTVQRTVAS